MIILDYWARIWQLKLLIATTFEDLVFVPFCTLFTDFVFLTALNNDLANFIAQWMTQSAPMHGISLIAVHQKGEAVQRAKWVIPWSSRYWNKQLGALQFLPGSCIMHTYVIHVKAFFCAVKSINALSISYSSFLAEPQERWSETTWKLQLISVRWVGDFLPTVVCHNSDNQQNLPPLFWLQDLGSAQGLGQIYVLQYLCSTPLKMVE